MWLDRYRGLLCDLDGCLVSGGTVLPGAREFVTYAGDRLWIVSNNSTDTPTTLARKLARLGLPVAADHIILAGTTAVEHLATCTNGARVAIYGSQAIISYALSLGLTINQERPDFVLMTRDVRLSYSRLNRIVRQINEGAQLLVSNLDVTHPGTGGRLIVETGALLKAVRACVPDLVYQVIGKPSHPIYQAVVSRLPAATSELLAIGDNPATDGEGARRMGIAWVLVGSGRAAHFKSLILMLSSDQIPSPAADGGPAPALSEPMSAAELRA